MNRLTVAEPGTRWRGPDRALPLCLSSGGEPRRGTAGIRLGPGLPAAGRVRRQQGQVHSKISR